MLWKEAELHRPSGVLVHEGLVVAWGLSMCVQGTVLEALAVVSCLKCVTYGEVETDVAEKCKLT